MFEEPTQECAHDDELDARAARSDKQFLGNPKVLAGRNKSCDNDQRHRCKYAEPSRHFDGCCK